MDQSAAESDAPEVPAQSCLIVSDALATSAQREQLLARARAEGPSAAEDLRTAARSARSTDNAAGPSGSPRRPPTRSHRHPSGRGARRRPLPTRSRQPWAAAPSRQRTRSHQGHGRVRPVPLPGRRPPTTLSAADLSSLTDGIPHHPCSTPCTRSASSASAVQEARRCASSWSSSAQNLPLSAGPMISCRAARSSCTSTSLRRPTV